VLCKTESMKKIILSLLFLMVAFSCKSQDKFPFDWDGKSFIDSLRSKGITNIVSFKEYFPGAERLWDNPELACESEDIYYDLYFVWLEKDVAKLKKFNNCFEFNAQQSDTVKLFDFIVKNGQAIYLENQQIEKRKKSATLVLVSHSNQMDLSIYTGDKQESYHVDETVVKLNKKVYGDFKKSKMYELMNLLKSLSKIEFEKVK
jgi:hypothetical protein